MEKGKLYDLVGLDHVVLRVKDMAASIRFYTETLGLTLDHVDEKISLVQLRCGAHLIDLLPLLPNAQPSVPDSKIDHICLSIRCESLENVVNNLKNRRVMFEGEIVSRRGAFGQGPSIYLRDPDGYRIELKPR